MRYVLGKVVVFYILCLTFAARASSSADTCETGSWVEEGFATHLQPSNPSANAGFGRSIVAHDQSAIVGAPGEDQERGAAYIIRQIGKVILKKSLEPAIRVVPDPEDGLSKFGSSVSMDKDKVLIGAPGANEGTGAAYLFQRDGTLIHKFLPPANSPLQFGRAVALQTSGKHIVAITGYGFDPEDTQIFLYHKIDGSWPSEPTMELPSPPTWSFSPVILKLQKNSLFAGVTAIMLDSSEGNVAVYTRSGDAWDTQPQVINEPFQCGDLTGFSCGNSYGATLDVSSDGLILVVGAPAQVQEFRSFDGEAFVYKRDSITSPFQPDGSLRPPAFPPRDTSDPNLPFRFRNFGTSVAVTRGDEGYIVTVSYSRVFPVAPTQVYVFERKYAESEWVRVGSLTSPGMATQDKFGSAVALTQKYLLVGIEDAVVEGTKNGALAIVSRAVCQDDCQSVKSSWYCRSSKCYWMGGKCYSAATATETFCNRLNFWHCSRRPWCTWHSGGPENAACHSRA